MIHLPKEERDTWEEGGYLYSNPNSLSNPLRGGELLFIVVVQNGVERREAGLGAG